MRDRVQERLQSWSYRSTRRRTATRLAASKVIYLQYAGLLVLAVRRRASLSGADLLRPGTAVLLAKLCAMALHRTVIRPRPFVVKGVPSLLDVEPDNGFPSDHALQVGSLVVGAWVLEPRTVPLHAFGGTLTLAARLGAGVHHTGDILGGLALVGASAGAVYMVPLPAAWRRPLREQLPTLRSVLL